MCVLNVFKVIKQNFVSNILNVVFNPLSKVKITHTSHTYRERFIMNVIRFFSSQKLVDKIVQKLSIIFVEEN